MQKVEQTELVQPIEDRSESISHYLPESLVPVPFFHKRATFVKQMISKHRSARNEGVEAPTFSGTRKLRSHSPLQQRDVHDKKLRLPR